MTFQISNPNKPCNSELFYNETGCTLFIVDGEWFIQGVNSQEEAEALIAAHNPPAPSEPTVAEKLASVGLNLDDLKEALGLG